MSNSLDAGTQEKIQALCREISVAHHLDAEIQRELYGHMEDKTLAFLSGEERITAEDALILTRAHFGDPAVLKALLQQVHGIESRDGLARRIVGVLCTSTALSIVFLLAGYYIGMAFAWAGLTSTQAIFFQYAVTLALLWFCLFYWQRRLDAGKPPWFVRWKPSQMAACLAMLFLVQLPLELRDGFLNLAEPSPLPTSPTPESRYFFGIMAGYLCVQCLIWLWWCDRPPRLWQNLIVTGLAWILCGRMLQLGVSALFRLLYAHEISMQTGLQMVTVRNQIPLLLVSFWSGCAVVAITALVGYLVMRAATRLWNGRRADVAAHILH